jgi:hypothetical protein
VCSSHSLEEPSMSVKRKTNIVRDLPVNILSVRHAVVVLPAQKVHPARFCVVCHGWDRALGSMPRPPAHERGALAMVKAGSIIP